MIRVRWQQISALDQARIGALSDAVAAHINDALPGFSEAVCGPRPREILDQRVLNALHYEQEADIDLLCHYVTACLYLNLIKPRPDPEWLQRIMSAPSIDNAQKVILLQMVIEKVLSGAPNAP